MAKKSQEQIEGVIKRWSSGLGLSAKQTEKLRAIVTARADEAKPVRREYKGEDKKELRAAKLKEIRKKYRPKMEALLSDAQTKRLKELRKQWKADRSD